MDVDRICWEPDQGDYYVAGHNQEPGSQWDFSLGYDYCTTYEEKSLVEYTCTSNKSYECPYGCFNGRCTEEDETCPAGWYCYNLHSRAYLDSDCTWGNFEVKNESWLCQDGEFIDISATEPPDYWDVDGRNYNKYDFVYNVSENTPIRYDYCTVNEPSRLLEYYGASENENHECPYGCFNGRCTEEDETCPAGWYCSSPHTRAELSSECTWSNYQQCDEPSVCLSGECVNNCGNGVCEWYEDCHSCLVDCGPCTTEPAIVPVGPGQ